MDDPKAPIRTFPHEAQIRRAFAFSPDAESLVIASEDKTFHVSPLRFDDLYETATHLQSETSTGAR